MKIKFLSYVAVAALFAMGITSCEEEDFNTKVDTEVTPPSITIPGLPEGYKPGDAVISIQPSVWAIIDGNIQNVTAVATIKFDGAEQKVYTKSSANGFTTQSIEIAASYKLNEETTLTAETTVEVPALAAGQVAIFNPTLVMSYKGDDATFVFAGEPSVSPEKTVQKGYVEFDNASQYYYLDVTKTLEIETSKSQTKDVVIESAYQGNEKLQAIVNAFNTSTTENCEFKFDLWPETKTCFSIEQVVVEKKYQIDANVNVTRSASVKAAAFTVEEYNCIIDTKNVKYFNTGHGYTGHGHAHSHGHGHGHGADNAGGGIVWGI